MKCNVCGSADTVEIYRSGNDRSLTSLCEVMTGEVRVWSCQSCSHLFGQPLPDTEAFYDTDYKILLNHEDEDQIYEVKGDKITYRTDHQMAVLMDIAAPKENARVLDYGCAKAAMAARLKTARPDLSINLFDVSGMYEPYWEKFVKPDGTAIYETPDDWNARFDLVTSFFAFEHIPDPRQSLAHVHSLLTDDGMFYAIVPDTFGNIADFVVIDHVNHFTRASLHRLLADAGFGAISISDTLHRGALVFSARKGADISPAIDTAETIAKSRDIAAYWQSINGRLRAAEATVTGKAAIYGSGFYGSYILSQLRQPENVACFLDRNPFQQGKTLFSKPILSPEALPTATEAFYIGLNPSIARTTAAELPFLQAAGVKAIFLDEAA